MVRKLSDIERERLFDAIIYALYRCTGGSTKAHPPIEAIRKNLPKPYKTENKYVSNFKKVLKDTIKMGYISRHKTSGTDTYQLTPDGRDYAQIIDL